MRHVKSERLKKLEQELADLEQWLKLGLVPKKDVERHKEEIVAVRAKIEEEKERLQFLKMSGEEEEFSAPKRQQARAAYTELPTIPDIDLGDTAAGIHETGFDIDTETSEEESASYEERDEDDEEAHNTFAEEEDESFFSDKNRWRRGAKDIVDPDANEW
ncbi:hypothetical protein [Criblamydia sequanensis]|uniref:Uncharacterized protein n=1 Tax=Candidatus Criblamydia sequanensis CRIB-18 TaxID=1437425 RepID=A0A090D260_9BACT|nr:hypothetical protein [Criblamydia sequanensis]CDR34083.1 Conserved hypothetical protein [Criblamydia sequanensis CRIB-18]